MRASSTATPLYLAFIIHACMHAAMLTYFLFRSWSMRACNSSESLINGSSFFSFLYLFLFFAFLHLFIFIFSYKLACKIFSNFSFYLFSFFILIIIFIYFNFIVCIICIYFHMNYLFAMKKYHFSFLICLTNLVKMYRTYLSCALVM